MFQAEGASEKTKSESTGSESLRAIAIDRTPVEMKATLREKPQLWVELVEKEAIVDFFEKNLPYLVQGLSLFDMSFFSQWSICAAEKRRVFIVGAWKERPICDEMRSV